MMTGLVNRLSIDANEKLNLQIYCCVYKKSIGITRIFFQEGALLPSPSPFPALSTASIPSSSHPLIMGVWGITPVKLLKI
jgi:hypothetical protein